MKDVPLWLRVLGVVVALPVVGIVAYLGWYNVWVERNLPIYEISSMQSPDGGYAVNTLQYGDSSYVSGEFELWLKPIPNGSIWPVFRQRIGKTLDGGTYVRDSMFVYKLNGQDGSDWLVLEGLMTGEWVFRNTKLAPITLNTLEVTSLELRPNRGSTRTILRTEDQDIIREVMAN